MLVAPKITEPTPQDLLRHAQRVIYYLPEGETWYNYYTKKQQPSTGSWESVVLRDLEQAVFIRGGSILPILSHQNCLALLECYKNPINLEVYLDEASQAAGSLYIDDGLSHDYQSGQFARIQFKYQDNLLSSAVIEGTETALDSN